MLRVLASLLLELCPLVLTSTSVDFYAEIRRCSSTVPLTTVFQSFPMTSRIRCADVCSATSTCKAFSVTVDGTSTCSLHTHPPTVVTCTATERHFQKTTGAPCLNRGTYDSQTDACTCYDGYVGRRCERIMQDCSEGSDSGFYNSQNKVFWIFPGLAPFPFKAECWMGKGGRTLMQHQKYANVTFARSWAEYRSGFGQFRGDHWLGLDHVSYVTNGRPQKLVVAVITLDSSSSGSTIRAHNYDNFRISNESNLYRLTFDSETSTNDMGDCLTSLKNAPFSTTDVSNVGTCASDFNAGWWFTAGSCSSCNPNGVLRKDLYYWSHDPSHTHWNPILDNFGILEIGMFLIAK